MRLTLNTSPLGGIKELRKSKGDTAGASREPGIPAGRSFFDIGDSSGGGGGMVAVAPISGFSSPHKLIPTEPSCLLRIKSTNEV